MSDGIEIHPPIRYGLRASKSEHDELVRVVNGDKTSIVGPNGVLELKQPASPCSFNQRAVSDWTSD